MANSLENQYDNDKFIDYYKILDVDILATNEQIKSNYIKLAKKYHPDQINGNTEMFQLVTIAYETLIKKDSRKDYDLYFLKKSFNDLQEDTFYTMKDNFKDFIDSYDKKKLSKNEIDKMYQDIFNDKEQYKDKKLELAETTKKINDITFERETLNIENNDESLQNFIAKYPEIEINQLFEYIKSTNSLNKNNELVNKSFGTLDTLPGYLDNNFSSFIDEENTNSNLYSEVDNISFISNCKEQIDNINMEKFNDWKHIRKVDSKLNSEDIDYFINKRKQEENMLLTEVENNITNNIKNNSIKQTNLLAEDDFIKNISVNNIKKRI